VLLTSVNTVLHKTHRVLNYSIVYKVEQSDRGSKATELVIEGLVVSLVEGAACALSLIEQRVSIVKRVACVVHLI
jgi:putative exporter of polyketide antibiotics